MMKKKLIMKRHACHYNPASKSIKSHIVLYNICTYNEIETFRIFAHISIFDLFSFFYILRFGLLLFCKNVDRKFFRCGFV